MSRATTTIVMPALGAGIHDFFHDGKVVDGRAEPGHDGYVFVARLEPEHDAMKEPTP